MTTKTESVATRSPKQITAARAKEILEEFDVDFPTATTYLPDFQEDITIVGVGTSTPVNKFYCSTVPSALQLMCVLADLQPVGYMDDPQVFASGSPFVFSEQVPWLKFGNGAVRNAGQLAQYWANNNGDPNGRVALQNCLMDIAWG